MFFYYFLAFVILQRVTELIIAKRNEELMLSKGAVEYDKAGYKFIVLMHTAFFLSLIAEYHFLSSGLNKFYFIFLGLFILAQLLRYWAITSLGHYWNTRIIVLKSSPLIHKGPYKYLKHPNYIAVITELCVIPLIFSCYITCIVFSLTNLFVLLRRIKIEEDSLSL